MTEARGVDADKELIVFDLRYWAMLQLIWLVILISCQSNALRICFCEEVAYFA